MIGVRNLSGQKLVARYDGRDYTFPAEEKVTTPLSEDAARHIFGYGERDKTRALLRLGWVPNGSAMDQAVERLGKFQFLSVEEVKFKEEPTELPRTVASDRPVDGMPLSAEERELAGKMNKPEGKQKQFAK